MAKKKKVQASTWDDDPPEPPAALADGVEGIEDTAVDKVEPDWAPTDEKSKEKKK